MALDSQGGGARLVRQGRVVECDGEPVVRFISDCAMGAACCGRLGSGRPRQIPLASLEQARAARPGELICVAVDGTALTRAASLLFAVPLAALLTGAWLGGTAAKLAALDSDLVGGSVGIFCLVVSSLIVARRGSTLVSALRLTAHRERMN